MTGRKEGKAKYGSEDMEQLYGEYVKVMGPERAERAIEVLCATWGGQERYIPRISCLLRINRDRAIRYQYGKGESFAQLAASFNISESQVRRICFEPEPSIN